jgi:pimeloyl-ACP methyl ester carboxylesterase
MNAQQMVPSEYWRGPDRRPEQRPVIITGATRPPERDAEANTTPQIKWAGGWPAGAGHPRQRKEAPCPQLDKTASRLPGLIKDMHLVVVEGGPHAIAWTHAGQVNTALLDFLRT